MISVLNIGSLYWSSPVSTSYQQRDGVQQCTSSVQYQSARSWFLLYCRSSSKAQWRDKKIKLFTQWNDLATIDQHKILITRSRASIQDRKKKSHFWASLFMKVWVQSLDICFLWENAVFVTTCVISVTASARNAVQTVPRSSLYGVL